jgi:hypothetical protein
MNRFTFWRNIFSLLFCISPVPQKSFGINFESVERQKAETIDGGVAWLIIDVAWVATFLPSDTATSCLDEAVTEECFAIYF